MSKRIVLEWTTFDGEKCWAPVKNQIWKSITFFKNMAYEIEQCDEEVKITIGNNEPYYSEVIREYLLWCITLENTSNYTRNLTVPQQLNLMHLLAYLQEEHKLAVLMPGPLPEETDECIKVLNHLSSDVFWRILENYCKICRDKHRYSCYQQCSGLVYLWHFLTDRPKLAEFSWSSEHRRKKTLEYLQINLKNHARFVKLTYREALIDLKDFEDVKNTYAYAENFYEYRNTLSNLFQKLGIDNDEKSIRNSRLEKRKQLSKLKTEMNNALALYNRARTSDMENVDKYHEMYLNCKQKVDDFEK